MFGIKEIKQETEIAEWIHGHNTSFKARSNERIPYSPLQRTELDLDKDVVLAHYSDETMVGGCYIAFMQGRAKLKHVWVLPEERRNGIAERMIRYSEDVALNPKKEQRIRGGI